ncbi:MAG TPA: DUF2497 domain-containing protein [Methylocystis sp.]|jgi:hypothetical protein
MSAVNASAPSPSIQEEMRAHEPSMEEILASIRRIIADDDSLPGVRRRREAERSVAEDGAPASQSGGYSAASSDGDPQQPASMNEARAPQPAPMAEIRPLRPAVRAAPEPVEIEDPAPEEEDLVEESVACDEEEESAAEQACEIDDDEGDNAPLVSADAASCVASHFQALATSMIINDSGVLQKYAQEMLRPMLKQWLDDNLPVIVERLVRAEIERVARGGRR